MKSTPTVRGSDEGRTQTVLCRGCWTRFDRRRGTGTGCPACPPGTPSTTNLAAGQYRRP